MAAAHQRSLRGGATQTFVGQNLGLMQTERARKGVKISLYISLISTAVLIAIVVPLARYIVEIFIGTEEAGVIRYGTTSTRSMS